jgi:AcrR family transcriptional regulator
MPASKKALPRPGRPRDLALPARRRAQIIAHAIERFAKSGYAGTDLDAIAAAMGCAKGTLYNYFPTKRELFSACVHDVMRGLSQTVDSCPSDDPVDQLRHLVRSFFAYFATHPAYVELLIQERSDFRDDSQQTYVRFRARRRRIWGQRLRTAMAAGRLRPMPAERAIDVLTNTLYGTIFNNYFRQRRASLSRQTADVLRVILTGVLTPEEQARQPGAP